MTFTATEFAEIKRIGLALDRLVNSVVEVGIQLERVANSLDEIKSATVEEIATTLEETEVDDHLLGGSGSWDAIQEEDPWSLQGLPPDPVMGGL